MKELSIALSKFVGKKLTMMPWGMSYWQRIANLNERYFFSTTARHTEENNVIQPCCDLGEMTDDSLLQQYHRTHDASLMGELYKRYAHLVLGSCIKYLKVESRAQDAVSEIFVKLIQKLKTFRPTYFAGWLYKVTRNHCLEILRKEQSRPILETFDNLIEFDQSAEPEESDYIRREIVADELTIALGKIPECQKTCIQLFYLKGLSYKQVSEQTGYSMKEVKSYVQNGKRNLKNRLQRPAGEYGWKKSI